MNNSLKYKFKLITVLDLLFLMLLAISGSFEGGTSSLLYYLAFTVPIIIGITNISELRKDATKKEEIAYLISDFRIEWKELLLALPLFAPVIYANAGISIGTDYIFSLFGKTNPMTVTEGFFTALVLHALIPAVLEELLFRYVPIKLLGDSPRYAILLSSVAFAFAHASLFQIPYALVAGIAFAALYLMTGSIIPSLLLHFINNAVSLISIFGYGEGWLTLLGLTSLAASLIIIVIFRKPYLKRLHNLFSERIRDLPLSPLIFIGVSLLIAVTSLIAQ